MCTQDHGWGRFLASLVPEQARAIRHLHITVWVISFGLTQSTISLLKGLKHVEIEIWATHWKHERDNVHWPNPQRQHTEREYYEDFHGSGDEPFNSVKCLDSFKRNGGVEWLKTLGLLSIRFNLRVSNGVFPIGGELKASLSEWFARWEKEIVPVKPSRLIMR